MKHLCVGVTLAVFAFAGQASAGTFFGALSNFDAVNDTGSPCNGFEIELDDIQSRDVTYTFEFQRYGVPKITEDTFVVNGVSHPRTFVRWMSSYDQVNHVFLQATPVAPPNFQNTGGHLCFRGMVVGSTPYDTSGCEHFGVGTLKNPSNTVYRWMKEDPTTPGSLIAQGSPVTIPAPVWTVNPVPNAPPIVVAVIPVPPPPAVVPVPYLPNAEFGVAVWAKVFETESTDAMELDHLVSDNVAVPGNLGPVPNPDAVTEIEWQILQTDTMNPTVNELQSSRQVGGNDHQSVTRRYEFYKYIGPYEINSSDGPGTGTNEALCTNVDADGMHGAGAASTYDANGNVVNIDCGALVVIGDFIGSQNAAANIATPLSANGTNLVHGEVGVRYPDRPLIFGGSGGPYSIAFTTGTLPATDAGNEFTLDPLTGLLIGGIPNGTGTASFTVHATDLVDPTQPAVDPTFNITVVDAVTVDDIVIPDGVANVATTVDLTASGGETPFIWSVVSASAGLQASVIGNTLSLTANAAGAFSVQVTVDDSLGGTNTKTLNYSIPVIAAPTDTPTNTPVPPTSTPTGTPVPPTSTPTDTPVPPTSTPTDTPAPPTSTPTDTPVPPTSTPTYTPVPPTETPTNTPAPTNTPIPPTNTQAPTSTPTAPPSATLTSTAIPTFTATPSGGRQACLNFELKRPNSGAIRYLTIGGALRGMSIPIASVTGVNTPAGNGVETACIGCMLNFTTGNLQRNTRTSWVFGSGGTITLTGSFDLDGDGASDVPPGSALLTGSFTAESLVMNIGSNIKVVGGSFDSTQLATLANFYGLTSGALSSGGVNVGFYGPGLPPGIFASATVIGSNVVACESIP